MPNRDETPGAIGAAGVTVAAAVAAGLQAQLVLPLTAAGLHVSAADPLIAALAAFLAWRLLRGGWAELRRSVPPIALWVLLPTFALTLSLATGIARLGHVSGWALGSKYVGWFVLLGYFAAGVWISVDERRARIACQAFLCFLALVGAAQSLPHFLADLSVPIPFSWRPVQISGLTENRNSFAFLLLVGQAVVYAHWHEGWLVRRHLRGALTLLFWAAMWYDASRTGLGATLALAALVVLGGIVPWRDFVRCCMAAGLVALLAPTIPAVFSATAYLGRLASDLIAHFDLEPPWAVVALATLSPPQVPTYIPLLTSSAEVSLQDRIDGYWLAWELFRRHPVLGAGLGSFIEAHQATRGFPQVIHGSFVWIATEMGLAGLAAFGAFAWRMLREFVPLGPRGPLRTTALLTLFCYALLSLAHELTYQRALWLMIGLAAVRAPAFCSSARAPTGPSRSPQSAPAPSIRAEGVIPGGRLTPK
jgi:hypothetical protein